MPQTILKQPLGRLILRILDITFVLVLLLVGYLSLRSSGYLTELWWFPRGVAEWSDSSRHYQAFKGAIRFRNPIPITIEIIDPNGLVSR